MMRIFYLIIVIWLFAVQSAQAAVPSIITRKDDKGWELLVNGEPFVVRGVTYTPTTVGESSDDNTRRDWMSVDDDKDGRNDFAYQTWVDANANGVRDAEELEVGDFELLKRMGVNTIRVYHHTSDDPQLKTINRRGDALLNHPPNKKLLRELFERYGIRVAMGDLIGSYTVGSGADWEPGTDYTNRAQRAAMLHSVEIMVNNFKDEPYILMWVLGNENNLQEFTHTQAVHQMQAYAEFVNEAAALIKKIDGGRHPIAICHGGLEGLETLARYAPNVDIFGTNLYRNNGFQELWKKVAKLWDRPILLTEYGTLRPVVVKGMLNEGFQSSVHKAAWSDIVRHTYGGTQPGNAIGGFAFEWVDEWWFNGDPKNHNTGAENGSNQEYNGLTAMADGPHGSLGRRLREVYRMYRALWTAESLQ